VGPAGEGGGIGGVGHAGVGVGAPGTGGGVGYTGYGVGTPPGVGSAGSTPPRGLRMQIASAHSWLPQGWACHFKPLPAPPDPRQVPVRQ
jgi:hypothetical protein